MSASSKKKLRKEQNFVQLTEKQLNEQKEAKKLKINTIIFTVVILSILVVGIAVMGISTYNNSGLAERNTTALVVGEHKLSAAELNYFYMDGINNLINNWYNTYGDYAATYLQFLLGLDVTQPLNEQMYNEEEGITFAQYFTDAAVSSAVSAYTAYDMAMADGKTLTEEQLSSIDSTIGNIELFYASQGFSSPEAYLKAMYGNGATMKSIREYLEVLSYSNTYLQEKYDSITYTAEDLENYSNEHFLDYSSFSYCSFTLNTSKFLTCTASEDDENHTHSDLEQQNAEKAAKAAADALLADAPTDAESFNAAIKEIEVYAEDEYSSCSNVEDVLFTDISNEKIAEWISADDRKVGDLTVFTNETSGTTDNGEETTDILNYTVVLMMGRNDNNMDLVNVRHILTSYTGGTTDEYGTTTYSDEEKAATKEAAELLLNSWVEGGASKEAFIDLAKANSTDTGSASNGGLYENVYPGQMVETFNDWCFDESRQPGDYGIVESTYGVHVMYFESYADQTYREYMVEIDMRDEDYNAWYEENISSAAHEVKNTSKLNHDMVLSG